MIVYKVERRTTFQKPKPKLDDVSERTVDEGGRLFHLLRWHISEATISTQKPFLAVAAE